MMDKVLMVSISVVILACVALGVPSKGENHAGRTPIETIVAKSIAHAILGKLKPGFKANPSGIVAPKAPILPPLPDPDCFGPWHIPLDINIPEFEAIIIGDLNVTSESKLHGFSTISDDLAIRLVVGGVGVKWDFALPTLTMEGDSSMDLALHLGESSLPLVGGGPMDGSVEDIFLSVEVLFNNAAPGRNMTLRSLDFDLGFKKFYINLGHVTAGNEVVDWVRVSEGIQTYFDTMWNEEVIGIIDDALSCILNFAISGCRDLLGVPDCLKLDFEQIDAECFAPENKKRGNSIAHIGNVDRILAVDPFVVCTDTSAPTEDPDQTTTTGAPTTANTGVPTTANTGAPTTANTGAPTTANTGVPTTANTGVPTTANTGDPATTVTTPNPDSTTTTSPDSSTTTMRTSASTTTTESTTTVESTTGGVSSMKPVLSILLVVMSTLVYGF